MHACHHPCTHACMQMHAGITFIYSSPALATDPPLRILHLNRPPQHVQPCLATGAFSSRARSHDGLRLCDSALHVQISGVDDCAAIRMQHLACMGRGRQHPTRQFYWPVMVHANSAVTCLVHCPDKQEAGLGCWFLSHEPHCDPLPHVHVAYVHVSLEITVGFDCPSFAGRCKLRQKATPADSDTGILQMYRGSK